MGNITAGIRPYFISTERRMQLRMILRNATCFDALYRYFLLSSVNPINTVSCVKLFWTLVLVVIGLHFPYWRVLNKTFSRFCRFERLLLQIFTAIWAPSCCSRCTFQNSFFQNSSGTFQGSKFDLPKIPSLFFLVKSRLYFFKGSTFKPTSGLRNGAPPLFCFSNVLFFSSSVELNGKAAKDCVYKFEGKYYSCGTCWRTAEIVTFFCFDFWHFILFWLLLICLPWDITWKCAVKPRPWRIQRWVNRRILPLLAQFRCLWSGRGGEWNNRSPSLKIYL